MEALHLHLHLTEAAELIHQRGVSHVVVSGVGEDDDVRGHLRLVLLEEAVQRAGLTGIVHLAPAFGEDDAEVGRRENLPVLNPVDAEGTFDHRVTPWVGRGVRAANPDIVTDLEMRGILVREESYNHSYPHCWRCSTPLIYWAKTSWFARTSERLRLALGGCGMSKA